MGKVGVASRIKGQQAICKSLRRLLVRLHRYGEHRASTPEQRAWAGDVMGHVTAAIGVPTTGEGAYERRPAHKTTREADIQAEAKELLSR